MCRTSPSNSAERAEHATEVMSAAGRLRDVVGMLNPRLKSRGNSRQKTVVIPESRGNSGPRTMAILCDLCDNLCVLCVRPNPKDVRKRQGGSDQQKTLSSQSDARRGREGEESRGSVFGTFANTFAFFALQPIRKM